MENLSSLDFMESPSGENFNVSHHRENLDKIVLSVNNLLLF